MPRWNMTKEERDVYWKIYDILNQTGYKSIAEFGRDYDINLVSNPDIIGFMEPARARIVLNRNLPLSAKITVYTHEVFHYILKHIEREINYIESRKDLSAEQLNIDDMTFRQLIQYLGNVAADLDLSRYYNDADIEVTKQLGGLLLSTHPEWEKLDFEDIYDKLLEEIKTDNQKLQQYLNQLDKQSNKSNKQDDQSDNSNSDQNSSNNSNSDQDSSNNEESSMNKNSQSNENGQSQGSGIQSDNDDNQFGNIPNIHKSASIGDKGENSTYDQKKEDEERLKKLINEIAQREGISKEAAEQLLKDEAAKLEKRAKKLSNKISNSDIINKLRQELELNKLDIERERQQKETKRRIAQLGTGFFEFEEEFTKFINSIDNYMTVSTYSRPNRRDQSYNDTDSDIQRLIPGEVDRIIDNSKPLVNVYLDASSSFTHLISEVTGVVQLLAQLEARFQLKYNIYYDLDDLYPDFEFPNEQNEYGRVIGQPKYGKQFVTNSTSIANGSVILADLQQDMPQNIVIMTDSDADAGLTGPEYECPGKVFILYNAKSPCDKLMSKISTRHQSWYYKYKLGSNS